ncbi:MAG: hypothetical protein JWR67_3199 [Mucilaginibacter sp.]|nr:hypothetical protein [Mucilaginibacter sp.]
MKSYSLIFIHMAVATVLFAVACSDPVKSKLKGKWTSKDGKTKLQITEKHLTMDDNAVVPEEYFIKGDTIFTSYEGNRPYTKFVVQKLEENSLMLLAPDSTIMEFSR